jgi:RNA polymerase sigma-B factor
VTGQSDRERRAWQDGLARAYQRDPRTQEQVVTALLPLVHSIARRYKRGEEPLDDLVQVGAVGLLKALNRFEPGVGRHFVAYAIPTITGEIRRHYRDTAWAVHVPRGVQELAQKVTRADRDLFAKTGRPPSIGEISAAVGRDQEAVLEAWIAARGMRATPLTRPKNDDETEMTPDDRFLGIDEPGFSAAEDRATLEQLSKRLSRREREILALRFGEDLSQREVGQRIGLSQMHVSRVLRRVIEKLETAAARPDAAESRRPG